MNQKADDGASPIADAAVAQKMFPDRSTEEVVADIVAAQPEKHGVPLAERLRRAQAAANAGDEDVWEAFARARVAEVGGDFEEMMPGNKPRYTVEENGDVKDHETGEVHKAIADAAPQVTATDQPASGVGPSQSSGNEAAVESADGVQPTAKRARGRRSTTKKGA